MKHPWLRGSRTWRRDFNLMERLLAELPDYWDDLPTEARDEILVRLERLRQRAAIFAEELRKETSGST